MWTPQRGKQFSHASPKMCVILINRGWMARMVLRLGMLAGGEQRPDDLFA